LANAEINKFSPYGGVGGFDFDFKILTAFIRLGRAGPVGAGCPPYYLKLQALCPPYYYFYFLRAA
jgi:hypothetical protein